MDVIAYRRKINRWCFLMENKVHIAKLKPKKTITTFQQALRPTIIIGQLFSLIPVVGIFSNDAYNVRFKKTSWKCMYSFFSLVGQMFMALLCINKLAHSAVTLNGTSPVIFYITTCVTMAMFIQVARRWPQLVQHISKTEELDPCFDMELNRKCFITCAVVLLLALMEHILSLLSAMAGTAACVAYPVSYEAFVTYFYPWVFNFLPYSPYLGMVTQFLHFQSTFIWNFSDLFVICMSYYLTSRLQQVNKKLLAAQGKYLPEVFWRSTREDYCRATQIVRKVDDVISGIVFISFANNLFFVCLQLFNTLEVYDLKKYPEARVGVGGSDNKRGGWAVVIVEMASKATWKVVTISTDSPLGGHEAATYFLFSLVYLLSRSVAVSLIASQVHTASGVPAPVLYEVPSPVYCIEVQRFLDQVNGDKVALSGLQFFLVTKGLLLTVAGTIVTYELVMFQFNSPENTTTLPNVSTTMITTVSLL